MKLIHLFHCRLSAGVQTNMESTPDQSDKQTSFPPELLDNIFAELASYSDEAHAPDWTLSAEDWHEVQRSENVNFRRFPCSPAVALLPLLTVSKTCHELAERRLYRSISIDEYATPGALAQLLYTLTSNKRLVGHVRELRIHDVTGSEELHAQIITQCTSLRHLLLSLSTDWRINVLPKTVSNLRGLESLVFVREENPFGLIPRGVTPRAICSAAELLSWLIHWPEMDYIAILDIVNGDYYDDDDQMATLDALVAQNTACSRLRHFYTGKQLNAKHLRTLATIAPSLTSFDAFVDTTVEENIAALTESLHVWMPQLERLSVQIPFESTSAYILDDDFCRQLRGVKVLRVPSCLVPPSSFVHFTNAIDLGCIPTPPSGLLTLASIIPTLKSLKTLRIRVPDLSQADSEMAILLPACDSQGIVLKTSAENEWEDW